ncbi:MAG: RnfABCDGE type electron transport complex subunit D [Planctomycetes bacterium]|jgi:electron transport complex protein RnfD|nr:RnfABCDGE type electron transport complex subunit D [Planctomycetota bacterium]
MIETISPDLSIGFAPHARKALSTQRIMLDVILGLLPAVFAAGLYFRLHGLLLIAVSVASCLAAEATCNLIRRKPNSLWDLSAAVTGVILALSMPPALPLWAVVIGAVFAIAVGKMVFGGLGANIFNPAMVGRAFLTASFGILMTTWTVPATIDSALAPVAPTNNIMDIRTQATPLAWSKVAIKDANGARIYNERHPLWSGLFGEKAGSLGETSALALLVGGLYLVIRRIIGVHIPLAVLASAFVFATVTYLISPDKFVQPFYHLTSGALLLGAFFIATDPVTAPLTVRGQWIFGILIGSFTMLVRVVGEYPEGFMYAVLLANSVRPLIDKFVRPVPVGGVPNV